MFKRKPKRFFGRKQGGHRSIGDAISDFFDAILDAFN